MSLIFKYPVDLTGTNSNNLISNEQVDLTLSSTRLFKPEYGTFFEQGLVVRDFYTLQPLTPRVDFVVAQLDPTATMRSGGKACYQLIIILNPSLNKVLVQYQAVGGDYNISAEALASYVANLENDSRPITWGMIVGTPTEFPAAPHKTNAWETYGYADLIFAISRLGDKIRDGDIAAFEAIYTYIDTVLNNGGANIATSEETFLGTNNTKAMSPLRTKQAITLAIQNLTTLAQTEPWEYDVSPDPESWGYMRNKSSGLTLCWGSGAALAPDEQYRVNYRRRFDATPLLIPGDVTYTGDTTPSGSQWGEAFSRIPAHGISNDGFYVTGMRLGGTGNDKSRVRYLAIGISGANQPLAYSNGYAATIPPASAAILQPVWTGVNEASVSLAPAETKYIGIAFPSSVSGGGVIISDTITSVAGNIYYTQYPGYFVDSDYEVSATAAILDSNYPGNFTYVGTPLGQWIDLTVLKSKVATDATKGYMWTVNDQYAGTMRVTVVIRNKASQGIVATRIIDLKQSSNLAVIGPLSPGNAATENYIINGNDTATLSLTTTTTGITIGKQGGTEVYAFPRTISDLANYEVFVSMNVSSPNGYVLDGTGATPGSWLSADTVGVFKMTISNNNAVVNNVPVMQYSIRHKKDRTKSASLTVSLYKTGDGTLPVWNGDFSAMAWGSNSNNYMEIFLHAPSGSGYAQATSGQAADHGYFTYSYGKSGWDDANYEAKVHVDSINDWGYGTFSLVYVGAALDTWNPLTSVYRWNCNSTAPYGEMYVTVTIRHKITLQSASQQIYLGERGANYYPGGGVMI